MMTHTSCQTLQRLMLGVALLGATGCVKAYDYDYVNEPNPEKLEYVIGVSDVLNISVWRNNELSTSIAVRPDGTITMPLVGDLQAAGVTPTELRGRIAKRLAKYIKLPEDDCANPKNAGGAADTGAPAAAAGDAGASPGAAAAGDAGSEAAGSEAAGDGSGSSKPCRSENGGAVTISVLNVNSYYVTVTGMVGRPGVLNSKHYLSVGEAVALAGGPTRFASPDGTVLIRRGSDGKVKRIPIDYDGVISGDHPEMDLVLFRGDKVHIP